MKKLCEAKDDNYLLPGEEPTEEQMKGSKQKRKENDKKNVSREAEVHSGQLMATNKLQLSIVKVHHFFKALFYGFLKQVCWSAHWQILWTLLPFLLWLMTPRGLERTQS